MKASDDIDSETLKQSLKPYVLTNPALKKVEHQGNNQMNIRIAFLLTVIVGGVISNDWEVLYADDDAAKHSHWVVDSQEQWTQSTSASKNLAFDRGLANPTGGQASFSSTIQSFEKKKRAGRITFTQSPAWDNWTAVPSVGPKDASNAPIFLPIADGDYWYFGEFKNQKKGYHAWRSSDMKTWKHLGPIGWSRWATTAEYVDGKIFLYYDEPNDQDPHLVIIENLNDKPTWRDVGKVLDDPTHGSDAGVIPAAINLDELPEGYGFGFEFKVKATNKNAAKPILDRVEVSFD